MIKIQRASCPTCLDKNDDEFVELDYRRPDVLSTLLVMQHRKCCYCEKSIGDLSSTEIDVDHFIPKNSCKDSADNYLWHKANKWENLLYACKTCNSRKSSKYPYNPSTGEHVIINPSENIDPEDHIGFITNDEIIVDYLEKNGSQLGRNTIEKLKLNNRRELVGKFRKLKVQIEDIFVTVINSIVSDDQTSIQSCIYDLRRLMSAHCPYTAFNRAYIKWRLSRLNDEQIPKLESRHNITFQRIRISFPSGYQVVR